MLVHGRKYKTRDGDIVTAYCVDYKWFTEPGDYAVSAEGQCTCGDSFCDRDIIAAVEPHDVNIDPEIVECV